MRNSIAMYTSYILFFIALVILFSSFVTVKQGTIAVVTIFGKYRRLLKPGLSLKIPLIEVIHSRVSIQNRSVELEFQAVTIDQANVYFKAMVLYSVNAISGSTESQGEVTVRLQNSGRIVNGVGADPDIIVASAKAYLSALSKLHSKADRVPAQG